MKRNIGIITILVGVGLFFISIIFSTGYNPRQSFFENISSQMEIVLYKGKKGSIYKNPEELIEAVYPDIDYETKMGLVSRLKRDDSYYKEISRWAENEKIGLEWRIAIPLKYPLSLSIVLILVGTGVVLLSKKQ